MPIQELDAFTNHRIPKYICQFPRKSILPKNPPDISSVGHVLIRKVNADSKAQTIQIQQIPQYICQFGEEEGPGP
jgi:hypothetical protein